MTLQRNGTVTSGPGAPGLGVLWYVPGVPVPGRPDDPGSSGRGLVGYIGLQAHGAEQDVVSFRNVRIRDLSAE